MMKTFAESREPEIVLSSFVGPTGGSDYCGLLNTGRWNLPEPVHRVCVRMRTLFKSVKMRALKGQEKHLMAALKPHEQPAVPPACRPVLTSSKLGPPSGHGGGPVLSPGMQKPSGQAICFV